MSETENAQMQFEQSALPLLNAPPSQAPRISVLRPRHIVFLRVLLGLENMLPPKFLMLDASHPWIMFWSVNALRLLKEPLCAEEMDRVAETVLACQNKTGGFGGAPGQPSHLAATYAAVMTLTYAGRQYWERVRTAEMYDWMTSLKNSDGSIRVCRHGEADARATYCALAVATVLDIATPELKAGVGNYLRSCQTYEGGFANMPFGEAHGGYAFCSVASLFLLNDDSKTGLLEFCDTAALKRWLIARQDINAPGFSGRTNKLVDGCYSHWAGGCWPLLAQVDAQSEVWSREGLRNYIVRCCESPNGGLRDKPGTSPDAYHSNYCLSGLSSALHKYALLGSSVFEWDTQYVGSADEDFIVEPINPVFGVPLGLAEAMHEFFITRNRAVLARSPSTKEYQGFALYLGASVVLIAYLLWAVLPQHWLSAIHIQYYPSRWWAIAVPAFVLMLMLYIYVALGAYNTERLTFAPTRLETVADKNTAVHDVPLAEVNRRLYSSK